MKNGTPALIKLMVLLAVSGWASHSLAGGLLSKPNHFFVSPNGNDQWNGRSADVGGTNGPQLSLAAAFNSVRRWRHNGNSNSPAVIWLRGGIYILKEPVTILPEDHDLTIAAVPGEMPVISGGKIIEGWQPAMLNTHSVWVAEVPEIENRLWFFRELWVNDRLATRAREPKTGSLAVESVPDAGADVPWQMGQNKFIWKPGNLKPWAHPNDAEVVETHVWVESHLPVRDIDASSRTLTFAKRSIFKMAADDLWWVEGAPEFLDQPGEWACDRAAGKIYYYPRPGETIGQTTAIAPVLTTLVNLNGDTERKQFINHVTFQGLTFSHAHWLFPHDLNPQPPVTAVTNLEAGGFGQAAIGVTGAVRGQGVVASRFENCRFIHLGGYGLELAGGCRSNVISRCEFGDLGGGGIKIGETAISHSADRQTTGNDISDCDIHDGGRVFPSAIGIWIGQSPSNHIDHNVIHDFYYTAISIGWTWGYGEALAGGNVVEYNHIHHIGRPAAGSGPVLSDMGGIYTLGKQPGTRIVNNLWHDIAGLRYGGWGIYFDEGSSGIVAESNIVYNTTHGGFHQHYGETNLVRNNLFANGRDQQIQRTREEDHISFYFTNNMVLFEKEPILAGNWSSHHFVMDGNIYWQTGRDAHPDKLKFAGQIFSEWQLTGHDQHSLVADPRILDFTNGDLRISPDSPAISLGFLPFNLKDVGPRGRLVETSTP